MAEEARLICLAAQLEESGQGVRFTLERNGNTVPAFAIRYQGVVFAYLNQCAHIPAELDWQSGAFFDYSKIYLVCSLHGALYSPKTGQCLGGPCQSRGLIPLAVEERDGAVYLTTKNAHGKYP